MQSPFYLNYSSSVTVTIYAAFSNGTSYTYISSSSSYNYSSTTYTNTTTTSNTTTYSSPSPPGIPVTINVGTNIVVTWTAPTSGAPFLNYTIMIGTASGQWATTTYCNGANATVMANLNCTIP